MYQIESSNIRMCYLWIRIEYPATFGIFVLVKLKNLVNLGLKKYEFLTNGFVKRKNHKWRFSLRNSPQSWSESTNFTWSLCPSIPWQAQLMKDMFTRHNIIFQSAWHFASVSKLKFSNDDYYTHIEWIFKLNGICISNRKSTNTLTNLIQSVFS